MADVKILIADALDPTALSAVSTDEIQIVDRAGISAAELAEILPGHDALVVRSRTKVTRELLERSEGLRVIGRAGSGVDNIDVDAASERGILVMNTPGANSNSAAEHTIAMILALCRNIPAADAALRAGRADKRRHLGVEVRERRLALIGLGRIGSLVAEKARGLGMKVVGYDPLITSEAARSKGIDLVDLEDAIAYADVISLHVPLTESTRHMISADVLAMTKPGVRIVNCARGGLIDETALHEALVSGQVAGAALDVFESEPPFDSPLLGLEQVVLTPHLGASTVEAQQQVARRILEQVGDFLVGKGQRGAVNGLVIEDGTRADVKPFLELAERLGRVLSGIQDGIGRLAARYHGELPTKNARALSTCFLVGLMRQFLGSGVNELNAWKRAQQRGIQVEEILSGEHPSFRAMIDFTLESDGRKTQVAGVLFGRNEPRIIRIDGYEIDCSPRGWMLFVSNRDVPGIVGLVGSSLGAAGVNIANLSLGRDLKAGKALAVFNLDSAPDAKLLEALRAHEGVLGVRLVDAEAPAEVRA